ncbi:hypothetical protein ACKWTF_014579 [Chironomus riparius]
MELKNFLWIFGFASLAVAQSDLFMKSRQSFALNLFKNSREPVNVVMSPISMDYALNVLFLGATKETLTSLKTGLEYPKKFSLRIIESKLQAWTQTVGDTGGVEMVTKLYVNKTVQTMKNYTSRIQKALNATTESIAFANNIQSAKKINDWIANATHNLIQNLIPSRMINKATKMLIVNCIYFKANWQVPFKKSSTFSGGFKSIDGKTIPVEYMTRTGFFDYSPSVAELNGAAAVSIEYKDSNASMLFILPSADTDVETWIGSISKVDWDVVGSSLNNSNLNVTIPKFNITYLRDMTDAVKAMSMDPIFHENATFDKMFTKKHRAGSNVCNILQKAVICVDEEGTIAAAVSVIMMGSGRPSTPPIFLANRPFLFVIRSGPTILFMGQFFGIEKNEVNLV